MRAILVFLVLGASVVSATASADAGGAKTRADAKIAKRKTATFKVNDFYSPLDGSTSFQHPSRTVAPGEKATFYLKVQNDGPDRGPLELSAGGSQGAGVSVQIKFFKGFRDGGDVTDEVMGSAHGFILNSGQTAKFRIRMKARSASDPGSAGLVIQSVGYEDGVPKLDAAHADVAEATLHVT